MTEQDKSQTPPKIEFPCDYPIKVMGVATTDFEQFVIDVMKKHDPSFSGKAAIRDSRKGKYQAVNVTITATGEDQLKAIFEELKASGRVAMVL
ncbi:DUF493 domain-containing protein [Endozoicomonas sp. SM1973]|uniref:UPF0250 protein H0A36_17990 n=1 Tax=Spartinivicinus marinus TaxID=2994442 RepID=A0A853I1S2_9GAMM|nr:DUF493 domain-containing protein [Spartinivicinus marinus]MCX4026010.1 DUF493 domain-containing protein [Spartinivicinus marinus]NYZ67910.1 DUF493 domain-containing protein [Spartinivicinus marinus]